MAQTQNLTDEQIAKKVKAGDVDAYGELMSRYEQKLLRYVIYLIHSPDIAADVVQDTFIKTYQNLNSYNSKYKFSSWVYRIAHNEAMNAIKKVKKVSYNTDIEEGEDILIESTIVKDIDKAILKSDVHLCLKELEQKYREVLMLQYYENMKYTEISDVLHIPVSTVGVWSSRAKVRLKEICMTKGVSHEQQ